MAKYERGLKIDSSASERVFRKGEIIMINEETINIIKNEINEKIIIKNRLIRSVEAQERLRTAQQILDIINKHTKK